MSLIIVGSVGLDNVRTPNGFSERALGGSAIYASIAAQNFTPVSIVGVVGTDFPGENIELLKTFKIDHEGLQIREGKTFHWSGQYNDFNRAETLDTQLNVFADFNPVLPDRYATAPYLLLGNIHPDLQLSVLEQMKDCRLSACDTMNFWITGNRERLIEVIKRVDILFINEEEIKMLTNEGNIFLATEALMQYGLKLVVVKRGEYGAVAIGKDLTFFTPIYPVPQLIDPTGAGDSFAGGFMGYLAQQNDFSPQTIKTAMVYGTVMASINVESFSTHRLVKTSLEEIEYRKQKIKESVSF